MGSRDSTSLLDVRSEYTSSSSHLFGSKQEGMWVRYSVVTTLACNTTEAVLSLTSRLPTIRYPPGLGPVLVVSCFSSVVGVRYTMTFAGRWMTAPLLREYYVVVKVVLLF